MKWMMQHLIQSLKPLTIGFSTVLLSAGMTFSATSNAADLSYYFNKLYHTNSGFLVQDNTGRTVHRYNENSALVPASTIKVLTAYMALSHWGPDHRFETDVYLDKEGFLWIKGFGDPYLVSEEMNTMAMNVVSRLRQNGITEIKGVMVDDSYFDRYRSQLNTPRSLNPYDAPLGALSANFNSIGFHKSSGGVSSIEWQTPLTDLGIELSSLTGNGKQRISLRDGSQPARYFRELFTVFLSQHGLNIQHQYPRNMNAQKQALYRHYNSRTLSDVVQNMLKYSNNFIANQLFLTLGIDQQRSRPATMVESQQFARNFINKKFQWKNYYISDGAGLSRETRISASQIVDLLNAFKPYAYLLPCIQNGDICAKTGTLSNVHSYAGYFVNGQELYPFSISFQKKMPYQFRKKMAKAFYSDVVYNSGGYNFGSYQPATSSCDKDYLNC